MQTILNPAFTVLVCSALLAACSAQATETEAAASDLAVTAEAVDQADTPIKGMWVWHPDHFKDAPSRNELLGFCQSQGINRLLVQVHYKGSGKTLAIAHTQAFASLISEAGEFGIKIEALDGEKSMATAENQPETLNKLSAILAFNQSRPEGKRLSGIHYDIEPYLMKAWSDPAQRPTIMKDLLDYYSQALQIIHEADPQMTLACDIPFWFDMPASDDGVSMTLEYNGQTKPIQQHIQDICDYVGIMSYRRDAVGPNSITDISKEEVAYAESIGKVVCPAVETVPYPEVPTISFHGLSAEFFTASFEQAWQAMSDKPGFGGMLIHCYPNVKELLESQPPTGSADPAS